MRSRTLLVAGVGAAAIALAGCSTTVSGSAAPQGATGSGGSGAVQIHTVADLGAAVQHNTNEASSVHMAMQMSVPGVGAITATGDARFGGSKTAERMSMAIPSVGDMQMVLVGGTFYMELPSSLSGALGSSGKPWVKFDLSGSNPLAQALGSEANLADQADPTQLLNQISAAGTIKSVTHETLNGQPVTHYSITVDVQKMAESMTGADQSEKQALSQLGISTMPFNIWVNSDNLPVKITTSVAFADPTSGQSQQVQVQVAYTDWGKPVTITAPPAGEVTTLGGN